MQLDEDHRDTPPSAFVVSLPLVFLSGFAWHGIGSLTPSGGPGGLQRFFAVLSALTAGVVLAIPWALIRWAPRVPRWALASFLGLTWAAAWIARFAETS